MNYNRDLVRKALQELSDEDFQKRAWAGELPGVVSSFTEVVCQLYDDSGLDTERHNLSMAARQGFQRLDELLNSVDPSLAPHLIYKHPAMSELRNVCQRLMSDLELD